MNFLAKKLNLSEELKKLPQNYTLKSLFHKLQEMNRCVMSTMHIRDSKVLSRPDDAPLTLFSEVPCYSDIQQVTR